MLPNTSFVLSHVVCVGLVGQSGGAVEFCSQVGSMGQWTIDGGTIERKTRLNHHVDLFQSYGEGISNFIEVPSGMTDEEIYRDRHLFGDT